MSTSDTQTFGDRLTGTTFEHTLVIGDGPYDHLSHTIQLHGNDSAPREGVRFSV